MKLEKISVTHRSLDDNAELLDHWKILEKKSNNRFFLSSTWISTWLEVFKPQANVLTAIHDGQVVGLGLFTVEQSVRHGFVAPRTLRFHQTGIDAQDQIWVEYNDFLMLEGSEQVISAAMQRYFVEAYSEWDEWSTGAITDASSLNKLQKLYYRKDVWSSRHYGVDLNQVRQQHSGYRAFLSRNTRYQINRCEKEYLKRGEVVIERADSLGQAQLFFDEIAPLHLARWHDQGGSGFSNPSFVGFHRVLIEKAWHAGQLELFRVSVAGEPIAYLYNYLYKNKVYFYLSAFRFEENSKIKPGLLAHAVCIENHLDSGVGYYDFMGGDMRYKKSLSNVEGDIALYAFQKRTPILIVERIARYFKHMIVSRFH